MIVKQLEAVNWQPKPINWRWWPSGLYTHEPTYTGAHRWKRTEIRCLYANIDATPPAESCWHHRTSNQSCHKVRIRQNVLAEYTSSSGCAFLPNGDKIKKESWNHCWTFDAVKQCRMQKAKPTNRNDYCAPHLYRNFASFQSRSTVHCAPLSEALCLEQRRSVGTAVERYFRRA